MYRLILFRLLVCGFITLGSSPTFCQSMDQRIAEIEAQVINWRRHLHQNPELGNREVATAAYIADHLESLGMEVRKNIAITGVVGVLHGNGNGPVIALRADIDALPVKELTGLQFASTQTTLYNGENVSVMHACGHDAHTAILMGAAQILSDMRNEFSGTVMFVFQPSEEGPPAGEEGGAQLMIKQGVFDDPRPDAILGLHVEPGPVGRIETRANGFLPSATAVRIELTGKQTHAARPWEGTDLINLTADIVKSLTTLSARQFDVFKIPNVITIATIQAGNRGNILPGEAILTGTIRTYSEERSQQLKEHVVTTVESLAALYGASANIHLEDVAAVTDNDPELLQIILPALAEAAGTAGVNANADLRGAAEDFSFFQQEIPGVYFIIGSSKPTPDEQTPAGNHSPYFDIDEAVLSVGVKAQVLSALRLLNVNSTSN